MDVPLLERLVRVRRFPAVAHPRHAREALAGGDLAAWTGGYAITVPEHRRLVEALLELFAWRAHGGAALVNGLYGTGKSHLLILLHLLLASPDAWPPFLETHPALRRFAEPFARERRLVVHFALDEYGPTVPLEEAVAREAARALAEAGGAWPTDCTGRAETWAAAGEAARAAGFAGIVLLLDELSLFLAGRSPARREADAAFLQFLAGWTSRAPVWLIGATQRALGDTGPLRTHSWRQVEDRFARHTIAPQQVGAVLRDKLLQRTDPDAARALVAAMDAPLPPHELHAAWPFHPASLDLLTGVVHARLSPHRGAVEALMRLEDARLLARPANRLITPLDILSLLEDDLRAVETLGTVWRTADALLGTVPCNPAPQGTVPQTRPPIEPQADLGTVPRNPAAQGTVPQTRPPIEPQADLGTVPRNPTAPQGTVPSVALPADCEGVVGTVPDVVRLLALLHFAERQVTVGQLRTLLFDGRSTPTVGEVSAALHALRRRSPYVAMLRDPDPAAEVVWLAVNDDAGALAHRRMREALGSLLPGDPRITEAALAVLATPDWPLATLGDGVTLDVPWGETPRRVHIRLSPDAPPTLLARLTEAVLAGSADGAVVLLLSSPAEREAAGAQNTDTLVLIWHPRPLTDSEAELWAEYAAWTRAAEDPWPAGTAVERRARAECRTRADELRPAVAASVRAVYLEGACGGASPGHVHTLAQALAGLLAPAFARAFPHLPSLLPYGPPPRGAAQQLLAGWVDPGEAHAPAGTLLRDYLERFAAPLGCVAWRGETAIVMPPCPEVLAAMTAGAEGRAVADVLGALARSPLGLPHESARLALACALRAGALAALDAFLQPLDVSAISLARADAVAFVGAPAPPAERHAPLVEALATAWEIAETDPAIRAARVTQRLRAWARRWASRLDLLRARQTAWATALHTLPWAWRATETALHALGRLAEAADGPAEDLLDALGEAEHVRAVETVAQGMEWWATRERRIATLLALPEGGGLLSLLETGEGAIERLDEATRLLDDGLATFRARYLAWHERAFGAAVIEGLREAFGRPAFRALRSIQRIPMALPAEATWSVDALALARRHYCPGVHARLEDDGCCAHCRLPVDSPSPMPDPARVRTGADVGLSAFAALLAAGPWADAVRARLPRAPQALAQRAARLLAWRLADGPEALLDLLNDPLLAWLTRDAQPAGARDTAALSDTLRGRDLTHAEAREALHTWLDPDGTLPDDSVVRFS